MSDSRHSQGVVLFLVLFFTLLLSASIATFVKRATVDAILARNREAVARSEALARGRVAALAGKLHQLMSFIFVAIFLAPN